MTQGVEPPEIIEVGSAQVACDGGGSALGHPKVYLNMGNAGFVECPYCDRRFVLKAESGTKAGTGPGAH